MPHSMLRVYPEREDFTGDVLKGLPIVVTSHRGSSAFNLSPFNGSREEETPIINYSYDNEKITPYSYYVYLDEADISVNYTLSHQSAIYELSYGKDEDVAVVLNSRNGELNWNGTAVSGYQRLTKNTNVYLYLLPEQSPNNVSDKHASGRNANLVMSWPKENKN